MKIITLLGRRAITTRPAPGWPTQKQMRRTVSVLWLCLPIACAHTSQGPQSAKKVNPMPHEDFLELPKKLQALNPFTRENVSNALQLSLAKDDNRSNEFFE